MNYTFEIIEGLQNTSTEIPVTTQDAQYAAQLCSGENAPNLYNVTKDNWIQIRNQFLSNAAFNGAISHDSIILVLIWFKQFNQE